MIFPWGSRAKTARAYESDAFRVMQAYNYGKGRRVL
jgi:hypothetical protein